VATAVEISYWKLWYSVMSESTSSPRPQVHGLSTATSVQYQSFFLFLFFLV